ncbi:MAG: hypothetical protein HKUEN02_01300 [Anaerolineaceae bacterium]|nr:MAG: hypothetical protein HKUEN02_01300 [Anaerolineaceae bacterium]
MQNRYPSATNGNAVASLAIGIISWLLFLVLLCLNYVVLPLFTVVTMGVGGILYICTLSVSCLSPLGWLIGTILGYVAKKQTLHDRYGNNGAANAGLIINAIGLGLTALGVCIILAYAVMVGGFGFLEQLQYQY